ncbi:MAG: DUF7836 family putative zinc-binding protein [Deltaproteobacteria bacterium]
MTIDLACAECEASFELDVTELLDEPGKLSCPNCDAEAPRRKVEALASAVDELCRAIGAIAGKFIVNLSAETDDLPAAYDLAPGRKRTARAAEEDVEEEEEEDDDESEDDELEADDPFGESEDADD